MQAELGESREWLDAMLRSAGEAVIATDGAGRIRFMNRAAENLIGCVEGRAIGRDAAEMLQLLDEYGEPLTGNPWKGALHDSATITLEGILAGAARECVPVIGTAARIVDSAGRVVGTVVTLREITERKRAEEQVWRSNRELLQFVYSVSHDLQEPLRSVSIYSELLERKLANPDPDAAEYLRFVRQGAERMSALLTDLRTYAGMSLPASREPEVTDAEVALQQVMANLAPAIDGCGAAVAHGALPKVPVHGSHLVQLFQNLISNSIKYRRDGHAPTVTIESYQDGGRWQFSFADNGSGIEPEYMTRIFDFCQRGHGAEIPGTGMGLAICRRIVQLYGGRIWVESTPGEGSTFRFTLPACANKPGPAPQVLLETV